MSVTPTAAERPLRRRLHSYIERRAWQRRPVSLRRERSGKILFGVLVAGMSLYGFATRDEGIRLRMIDYLVEMTGGEVKVGSARFEMFGGITLHDVRISAPFDRRLDTSAVDPESREIFSTKSLTLVHNPWRLLFGQLRIEHMIAAGPTITLAQNIDTGVRNWQLLRVAGRDAAEGAGGLGRPPRVTIRSAKAVAISIHNDGNRESREEDLDADVQPHPQWEGALSIEVRRYSEPAERTTVMFDPARRLVTNTPFVDARTVRLQVPRAAQQFFDEIGLRGEAKLSRMVYDAGAPAERDTQVELRNVECMIPLAMLRSGGGPTTAPSVSTGRGISMTGVRGVLDLRGEMLSLDISGRVNDAACSVVGTLTSVDRPPGEVGAAVRFVANRLPAPEGELRRQLMDDPSLPTNLRRLLGEYDPHGPFDLDLHLERQAGGVGDVSVRGTLRPVDATGRHVAFPYLVTDLKGEIRFEPPLIHLHALTGRHGPASIRVDSRIDNAPRWSDVRVSIEGRDVPLDDALRDALPPERQALWRRFQPSGSAQIKVRLTQAGSDSGDQPPPWHTLVTADLVQASLRPIDVPYALEKTRGTVEFDDGRVRLRTLEGRHGEATVSLTGEAGLDRDDPFMDLRLEARQLALDEALQRALPAKARDVWELFTWEGGRADLEGTIQRRKKGDLIGYSLVATLIDANLRYRLFPLRLSKVCGRVGIRPEGLTLEDLSARQGNATMGLSGEVRRLPDGHVADVLITGKGMALSGELYQALPENMRRLWDALQPRGYIDLRSAVHYEARGGEPWWRHRTEIEASGAAVCLAPFPLPISGLTARLRLNDRRIEVLSARGAAAGAPVAFSASIDLLPEGIRGSLELSATGLAISEDLLRALPEPVREALAVLRASGRFDLHLRRLGFESVPGGGLRWDFRGDLHMMQACADLGVLVRGARGVMHFDGVLEPDGRMSAETTLDLESASVAGWELRRVKAGLSKPPDQRELLLHDASAEVYGGEANAAARVTFSANRTEYDVSLSVRDMQLGDYLSSSHGADGQPAPKSRARGDIYGNLVLRGQTGAGAYREGSGEAFVREAQVWKLPLLFAIFQVLNLTPDENVFHDGWLQFFLQDDTITFEKIDLQGRAMSFVGRGTMTLPRRELDVTLLAGSPLRLRVPLLTDLLEGASREVMEVKIGGTLSDPKIRPRPMRSLVAILEFLLSPAGQAKPSRSVPPAGK